MSFLHWFRTESFTVFPEFDHVASHARLAKVLSFTTAELTVLGGP